MNYPFENGIDHLLFDDPTPDEYGFDPDTVDPQMWADCIEVARGLAHKIAEGLIEIEEDDDGELRLHPTSI